MRIFVTTDTHFGHDKLVEMGERPTDFESRMLRAWSRTICGDDLVIHLGDVAVGKRSDWDRTLPNLPGRKILVLGNHDRNSLHWYMGHGFDFACQRFRWEYHGLRMVFTHEPLLEGDFDLNIHGHLHAGHRESPPDTGRHFLVSMETLGYQLVKLDRVVELWRIGRTDDSGHTA